MKSVFHTKKSKKHLIVFYFFRWLHCVTRRWRSQEWRLGGVNKVMRQSQGAQIMSGAGSMSFPFMAWDIFPSEGKLAGLLLLGKVIAWTSGPGPGRYKQDQANLPGGAWREKKAKDFINFRCQYLTAGEKWNICQTLRVALTLLTRCDVASVPVFAQSALSGSVSVLGRSQWPLTVHNKFSRYHNRVSRAETSHLESPDLANPVTRRTRVSSKRGQSSHVSFMSFIVSMCDVIQSLSTHCCQHYYCHQS